MIDNQLEWVDRSSFTRLVIYSPLVGYLVCACCSSKKREGLQERTHPQVCIHEGAVLSVYRSQSMLNELVSYD